MTLEARNGSQEPVTLEAVKSKFDHWRATRQKRGKTPESLWEDVRELSKSYGLRELSSSLGITYAQLHVHLEEGVQKNNLTHRQNRILLMPPCLLRKTPQTTCLNGHCLLPTESSKYKDVMESTSKLRDSILKI